MSLLFTVGYEGTDIDRFVATLHACGIQHVVDVRAVPISRKRGFSKSRLSERLAAENVQYTHLVDLGDPKPGRDAARAGRYEEFDRIYRAHLATLPAEAAMDRLQAIVQHSPTALLCFEKDPVTCHRSIVAEGLVRRSGLNVIDIYADDPGLYQQSADTHPIKLVAPLSNVA